jgi:hypothetical protein
MHMTRAWKSGLQGFLLGTSLGLMARRHILLSLVLFTAYGLSPLLPDEDDK